jgi:hypothetical protein
MADMMPAWVSGGESAGRGPTRLINPSTRRHTYAVIGSGTVDNVAARLTFCSISISYGYRAGGAALRRLEIRTSDTPSGVGDLVAELNEETGLTWIPELSTLNVATDGLG